MRIILFHPHLPFHPWFEHMAHILGASLESSTTRTTLPRREIDAIFWFTDVPFDNDTYTNLLEICTTIMWFLPRDHHYIERLGSARAEPIPAYIIQSDPEEIVTLFHHRYPHLFTVE